MGNFNVGGRPYLFWITMQNGALLTLVVRLRGSSCGSSENFFAFEKGPSVPRNRVSNKTKDEGRGGSAELGCKSSS